MRAPLLCQVVIVTVLTLAGHWELYLLLWLVPLATWLQLLLRVRAIVEHAMVPEARTTGAGLLARPFVAPVWTNYHGEHHSLVFVPCWKLARTHALLCARGWETARAPGYLDVIRRATSAAR